LIVALVVDEEQTRTRVLAVAADPQDQDIHLIVALESAILERELPVPHQQHPARITGKLTLSAIRRLNAQSGVVRVFYGRRDRTSLAVRGLSPCRLYRQVLGLPLPIHPHLQITKGTGTTGLAVNPAARGDCRRRAVLDRKGTAVHVSVAVIESATCDNRVRVTLVRSLNPQHPAGLIPTEALEQAIGNRVL
jgi:hypothetical protein